MPNDYPQNDSLSKVAIVAIVGLVICFLSTRGYSLNFCKNKEKVEVTANYCNQFKNHSDM